MLAIYLNGKIVKLDQAQFDNLLPGALKGKGAFETMRLYDGKIFAFSEHLNRLRKGLDHYAMGLTLTSKTINKIIARLGRVNRLKNARVRVIIWQDDYRKNVSISAQPLNLPNARRYQEGFKVTTSGVLRNRSKHSHVKSINYQMLRNVFKDAQQKGFDEAILLNKNKEIVEGTRTNIFFVKGRKLYTPAIRCGCLNGITRQKVIECARELHIPVRMVRAGRSQLLGADEAFLTGSTLEIMPIKSVDGKMIGKKRPGVFTHMLQQAYKRMVKKS